MTQEIKSVSQQITIYVGATCLRFTTPDQRPISRYDKGHYCELLNSSILVKNEIEHPPLELTLNFASHCEGKMQLQSPMRSNILITRAIRSTVSSSHSYLQIPSAIHFQPISKHYTKHDPFGYIEGSITFTIDTRKLYFLHRMDLIERSTPCGTWPKVADFGFVYGYKGYGETRLGISLSPMI